MHSKREITVASDSSYGRVEEIRNIVNGQLLARDEQFNDPRMKRIKLGLPPTADVEEN